MQTLAQLLKNFFTHKDFLPPASKIAGTMFTPLHFAFAGGLLFLVIFGALALAKREEKTVRTVFAVLWIVLTVLEITKIIWETVSGKTVNFEWAGILPLYPCSIFMYAMPLAVWGKGIWKDMGCGYVCTLGMLGGSINFVYPANILGNYSCISFAGFHTFLYHGALVFCTIVMLRSGYHSYKNIARARQLLIPAVPVLAVSVVANIVNFTIGSDYMFFRLNSFFFAPLGAATPDWLGVLLVYFIYLLIHALPYIPFYLKSRKRRVAEIG